MANRLFLGIKQSKLSTYNTLSDADKKGYVWFIHNDSVGSTTSEYKIYLGTKLYGETTDKCVTSVLIEKIRVALGLNEDLELPEGFSYNDVVSAINTITLDISGLTESVDILNEELYTLSAFTKELEQELLDDEVALSKAILKTSEKLGLTSGFTFPEDFPYDTAEEGIMDLNSGLTSVIELIETKIKGGLVFRGIVDYYHDLPVTAENGDLYQVKYQGESGTTIWNSEFAWVKLSGQTGNWVELGGVVDLSKYITKEEAYEELDERMLIFSGVTSGNKIVLSKFQNEVEESQCEIGTDTFEEIPTANVVATELGVKNYVDTIDTDLLVEITWDDLKILRDNAQLVKGKQYRIIDYNCDTYQYHTGAKSALHRFDIIVTADDESTINENARAIQHSGDTYFSDCNLNAWELKYCLDNDEDRFDWTNTPSFEIEGEIKEYTIYCENALGAMWATCQEKIVVDNVTYYKWYELEDLSNYMYTLAKSPEIGDATYSLSGGVMEQASTIRLIQFYHGVIYYMKDEWNNECPYDFKNVLFKRNKITATTSVATNLVDTYNAYSNSITGFTIDSSDYKYCYTFTYYYQDNDTIEDISVVSHKYPQSSEHEDTYYHTYNNKISMYHVNKQLLNNIVFLNTENTGHYDGCSGNEFGVSCRSITIGRDACFNKFGGNCYNTITGGDFQKNTFGNDCNNNIFDNNCKDNIFDDNCTDNAFGNNCYLNTFGYTCLYNQLGNYSYSNTFGNYCNSNTFGNYCNSNTFGNACYSNTFGNYCNSNTFGDYCSYNQLGNYCTKNKFGKYCGVPTSGSASSSTGNKLGVYSYGNKFGVQCYSNQLLNDAGSPSSSNCCHDNIFGNLCYSNTLHYYCTNNKFGNNCYSNTMAWGTENNKLGNGCYSNSFGFGCNRNDLGSGCYSNSIGVTCNKNIFGNQSYSNSLGEGCDNNSFGTSCHNNILSSFNNYEIIGNSSTNNTFGSYCSGNILEASCDNNTFGSYSSYNKLGCSCTYNTLGTRCYNNTLGQNCTYIKFGSSGSTISTEDDKIKSYYENIRIESGNQYIYLNCTQTTSASQPYRNIIIGAGLNNSTTYKQIDDGNVNQTYETRYVPTGSQTVII